MYSGALGSFHGLNVIESSILETYENVITRRPPNLFEQMEDYPWSMTNEDWFGSKKDGWATFDMVQVPVPNMEFVHDKMRNIIYCSPATRREIEFLNAK